MAKSSTIDQALSRLAELRSAGRSPQALEELRKALSAKSNVVVAKAAQLVGEMKLTELTDDLPKLFDRFMVDPTSSDKGCAAKTSIAKTLYELDCRTEETFLCGARHVQLEAAWGPPVDTAAELRGTCALGLVRMNYRGVMLILAEHLADGEALVRQTAARAIAYSGREDGEPLLRLRALTGDDEPQVIGECLTSLVKLSPARSLPFVERFIDSKDSDLREAALVALGESRRPEAFEILSKRWEGTFDKSLRTSLLPAMALLRLPQAIDFVIDVIAASHPGTAAGAVEAMRMFRHDAALRGRIQSVVEGTGDPELVRLFQRHFPST
jgi:HEAT repeat protein